jgi:single-strand DNA-binding protein
MNDTEIHLVGNLTAAPELRFTPSGAAVANFTVASTPRRFNKQTNAWEDQEALFMRCSIWRQAAENVAETFNSGDRVLVIGKLKQRSFEKDGQKRSVMELEVDEIGPSLKWATAKVSRVGRASNDTSGGSDDPWTNPAQAAADDSAPF